MAFLLQFLRGLEIDTTSVTTNNSNDNIRGDGNVEDKPFSMLVQQLFSLCEDDEDFVLNPDVVAAGYIAQGTIKIGDEVEIFGHTDCGSDSQSPPSPLKTKVTRVHVSKETVGSGMVPGGRVAIRLLGVKEEEMQPGMMIAKPCSMIMTKKFEAEIQLFRKEDCEDEDAYNEKHMPILCVGTSEIAEKLVNFTPGGDKKTAQIVLDMHAPLATVAFMEEGRIVGDGIVSKVIPN